MKICKNPECDKEAKSWDLCYACRKRVQRHGSYDIVTCARGRRVKDSDISKIRKANGKIVEIAKRFGLSRETIRAIRSGLGRFA